MRTISPQQEREHPCASTRETLLDDVQTLADELFGQADPDGTGLPRRALARLQQGNYLLAPLPHALGGLGLGTEPGGHRLMLRVLAALGSADLALGRLYEGHVNALVLIHAYGTPDQLRAAAEDARQGRLFGVWNTGDLEPMRLGALDGNLTLQGSKTFATGAGYVERPLVTAERNGWQMTLPRMEAPLIAEHILLDRESWTPFGMESSESLTVDFTGARLESHDLIGQPGDMYRDPLFRGGAIRFAAVQAGAVVRLASAFAEWLILRGRQSDPYQIARLGEVELLAQDAVLWIERAGEIAEQCLWPHLTDEATTRNMIRCGNMTRLAIERTATAMMQRIVPGVGAHGLLRPARFERIVRDLTMYLRQPNPDGALADVGRSALQEQLPRYWREPESVATPSSLT